MKTALVLCAIAVVCHGQTLTTPGEIDQPFGLAIGPDGLLYFCEVGNHRISRMDLKTRKITVFASDREMDEPYELAFDKAGDLFFCDRTRHVVRRVDHATGSISTVAGTGKEGFSGDGGPAVQAQLRQPHSIAFTPEGLLLICDIMNARIRAVDMRTGIISTWAGDEQRLAGPRALAIDTQGWYYLALREGNAIYRLDHKTGAMILVAGTGEKGYTGDGGDARLAKLSGPKGIACAPDGSLYIADTENQAIRRVDAKGIISTVARDLKRPHGVFVDAMGNLYISDTENNRILVALQGAR